MQHNLGLALTILGPIQGIPRHVQMQMLLTNTKGLSHPLPQTSIHTLIVVMASVLAREAESGRSLAEPGLRLEAEFGRASFVPSMVTSSYKQKQK